jgi:protochlorophyllide reductase
MPESGERLAQVVSDKVCAKSGVYWSWNGGAKTVAYVDPLTNKLTGAGGSGGEIFENDQSNQVTDQKKQDLMWDLSSKLVGASWPESYQKK